MLAVVLATGFTACKPKQPEQPPELLGGGAGGASWILQQILSGAASYTGSKCMGWLLSLVSGGSGNDQDAADFAQMESDLTTIINDLNAIQGQLNSIAAQINLDMATINSNEQSTYMESRESIIDNTYANMQALSSTMIGTPNGKTEAGLLASQIITGTASIDQQLYDIYYAMVGKAAGMQGSALNAFTDVLVAQDIITGPTDTQVNNRYLALEAYFKQLVQIQLKGAALMVDGLHYRDNPWDNATNTHAKTTARPMGLGDYPGTAEQWMTTKFQPQLEEQVEEFLRCTDRLVLFYSELRTDLTTTNAAVSMLPADADNIFSRADFIAAQLSSRHGFGLNVRLAGEPDQIQALAATTDPNTHGAVYNPIPFPHVPRALQLVPLGLSTDNGYPVRLNPVEKWWNWPTGYTPAYIQWNWGAYATGTSAGTVSGHISFNPATDIAVSKYNLASPAASYGWITCWYPNEEAQSGTYDNPVTFMNWYNDDMDVVPAGTAGAHYYGHGTLTIRHRPEVWYQSRSTISGQDVYRGTADSYLGPNVWVRVIAQLKQDYWGPDEDFNMWSEIAVPIINGSTSQQRMSVNGNMQADANNSFYQISIDQDYDRITAYWDLANGEEDWWGIQMGDPVTYDGTTAHHYFNPGDALPYHIQVQIANNASGDNGNSLGCRVWPQTLYLFF